MARQAAVAEARWGVREHVRDGGEVDDSILAGDLHDLAAAQIKLNDGKRNVHRAIRLRVVVVAFELVVEISLLIELLAPSRSRA